MSMLIDLSEQNFDAQVLNAELPVLVDFWAEWCGPCHAVTQILEEVAVEYKHKLTIAKLNVEDAPGIAARYAVRNMPSLLLFKNGTVDNQIVGAVPKSHITNILDQSL